MLNLTQHVATPEQVQAGVRDLPETARVILSGLLTFKGLPTRPELQRAARSILSLIGGFIIDGEPAMIGGAGFFLPYLTKALDVEGIDAFHAFSERVSIEETMPDGSVRKINMFKHVGFVQG